MGFWHMLGLVVFGGLMIGLSVSCFKNKGYWFGGMFAMISINYIVKMVVAILEKL